MFPETQATVLELFRRSETFFIILKAIKETMDQLCVVLLIAAGTGTYLVG
jgi:hypothetical protein